MFRPPIQAWYRPRARTSARQDLSSQRAYLRCFRARFPRGFINLDRPPPSAGLAPDDEPCEREERDLRAFAGRSGDRIVGVFKKTASASKNNRQGHKDLMEPSTRVRPFLTAGDAAEDLKRSLNDLPGWKNRRPVRGVALGRQVIGGHPTRNRRRCLRQHREGPSYRTWPLVEYRNGDHQTRDGLNAIRRQCCAPLARQVQKTSATRRPHGRALC